MKAVTLRDFGEADMLAVEEIDRPVPRSGEVLIRVEAASVNYADIVRRRNDPYMLPTPLPAVLGSEVAGRVEELGPGVDGIAIGDRVFALFGGNGLGGYAQFAIASAQDLFPIADELDFDVASTLVVAGVTAYQMLADAARLRPGETVFIPGGAGGVGAYAIQLALILGAGRVIAGGATPQRREQALSRGAHHAIDYTQENWPAEVKRLTGGKGADVVLDMIGGAFFGQSLTALAPFGRLVTYGTASRERSRFVPQMLMGLNQSVIGYYVSHWFRARPREARAAFERVASLVASGHLLVDIADRLPLEGAAEAHRTLEQRRSTGKIVLKPWLHAEDPGAPRSASADHSSEGDDR